MSDYKVPFVGEVTTAAFLTAGLIGRTIGVFNYSGELVASGVLEGFQVVSDKTCYGPRTDPVRISYDTKVHIQLNHTELTYLPLDFIVDVHDA